MRNTSRCATGHDRPESSVTIAGIRTTDAKHDADSPVRHRKIDSGVPLLVFDVLAVSI